MRRAQMCGRRWVLALVVALIGPPLRRRVGARRWEGAHWVEDGRIPRLSHHLNVDHYGRGFISVPAPPPAVAFELVRTCCTEIGNERGHSTGVITKAGGSWQVGPLPSG
jgi:hypothetical protein